jgi:KaiC/GvpD/RAD55 family RecA-like ATPase
MNKAVPAELSKSAAMAFVISQGWNWEGPNGGQIQVETCPFCKKGESKFYIAVCDPEESTRDGLFFCHHGSCQKTGNLRTLQEGLGLRIAGVDSRKEWAGSKGEQETLPDVDMCHANLLSDSEAMDYLLHVRGFSREIIEKQKLGLVPQRFFREAGTVKALVIPYLVNGNVVFAKYRTLPPSPKDFTSSTGWDAPLYNGEVLNEDIHDVVFVEGETNTISLLNHGVHNIVGVPGANIKKATWIEQLDKMIETGLKVYILYDDDKVGRKSAQEIASRIGYDKCYRMMLPRFEVVVPVDQCKLCDKEGWALASGVDKHVPCEHKRLGKDINEWFQIGGGTLETFEEMKKAAVLFDVTGVTGVTDALQQIEDELNGKVDLAPTYTSQYPELNKLVGFEDGDIIDIVAPEKVGKTTLGLNLLDHMVKTYGEDGLLVCLEMTQARLAKKWVSLVTGWEDKIVEAGTPEAKVKLAELKVAVKQARDIQQTRTADLYFAYPQMVKEPEDVFKLIRDCIRRYGVKWVMFDNVQRLCDDTLKNQAHRTVHMSQISKGFAKLAKDYRIKLIRILQPKRIEKGQVITTNDVDGSSQVAKDCDCMITMWRKVVGEMKKSEYEEESEGFKETDISFEPKTKLTVGLSRYSAGGSCYVFCDGARSQFRSYKEEEKAQLNANLQKFNNLIPMESGAQVPVAPAATANIPI